MESWSIRSKDWIADVSAHALSESHVKQADFSSSGKVIIASDGIVDLLQKVT